jgi:NADPH-dependent curcumin reductase CurA
MPRLTTSAPIGAMLLRRLPLDGVHVNFENVGGEIMATAMRRMALGGRMPLCGLISGYNDGTADIGDFSPILMRRPRSRSYAQGDGTARPTTALNRDLPVICG